MQTFTGTAAVDIFTANTGEDWTLIGRGGADVLTGNTGNDSFFGGFGNDTLDGGDGDDSFFVGLREGADSYAGGAGTDRILATTDNVVIGISALSGIEEISANGFSNVSIVGSNNGDVLDFSNVLLSGIVSINGGAGNDTLILTNLADVVNGGSGTDTINALDGDDRIIVGFGGAFDIINGGNGYDVIEAAADNVTMFLGSITGIEEISDGGFANIKVAFGATDDIINLSAVTLTNIVDLSGGNGNDTITGGAGDDFLSGGNGDDFIKGGIGSDTLNGNNGLDTLDGGAGDDFFLVGAGGAGKDIFRGGAGFDTIQGNADFAKLILDGTNLVGIEYINSGGFANFTIEAAAGGATFNLTGIQIDDGDIAAINGSFADDNITGSKVSDIINGGSGNDGLKGGLGDDTISGQDGDDTVDGGAGFDILTGGNGDDTLLGQGAADDIDGGIGNDIIDGGTGDDTLRGGDGDDVFLVGPSAGLDSYDGGIGHDTITATKNVAITFASLLDIEEISAGGFANVTIVGTTGDDILDFSALTLTGIRNINGLGGNDTITGSAGADTIIGGNASDMLIGGAGGDTLSGSAGLDFLTGGADNDIFRDLAKNLNGDTITDLAIGDRINVSNFAFGAAGTAIFANGDLRIDADGPGGAAAITIHLQGVYNNNFALSADPLGGLSVAYIG